MARTLVDTVAPNGYEQLFLDHLPLIRRTAAAIARRQRFSPADVEDFTAEVVFRFVNHDYAILRKFRGRAALGTYIRVVISRLCLDYRVAAWGKWRPSTRSREAGATVVALEQLTVRDGLTFEQACHVLETSRHERIDRRALERAYARFAPRRRPKFVDESAIDKEPATDAFRQHAESGRDDERTVARALAAIKDAVTASPEDRLLLKLRFQDGMSIANVARTMHVDQPALYRRFEGLCARLRRRVESSGVTRRDVLAAIGRLD